MRTGPRTLKPHVLASQNAVVVKFGYQYLQGVAFIAAARAAEKLWPDAFEAHADTFALLEPVFQAANDKRGREFGYVAFKRRPQAVAA